MMGTGNGSDFLLGDLERQLAAGATVRGLLSASRLERTRRHVPTFGEGSAAATRDACAYVPAASTVRRHRRLKILADGGKRCRICSARTSALRHWYCDDCRSGSSRAHSDRVRNNYRARVVNDLLWGI